MARSSRWLLGPMLAVLCPLLGAACAPELGACDMPAAVEIAYEESTGVPAYTGQALVLQSCANRGFCHSAGDDLERRQGVPDGLMFDVQLSGTDGTVDEAAIVRQRRGRFRLVQEARHVLGTIDQGSMPPPPPAGDLISETGAPRYRVDGDPLAPARTAAGREMLRNWLACGAPVVERSVPRDDGVPAVVVPAEPVTPLEPTWTSVFTGLLEPRCAGSLCHGAGNEAVSGFAVGSSSATHAALVDARAMGEDCAEQDVLLVDRADPDASLLLAKLRGHAADGAPVCGDRMPVDSVPVTPESLAAIREWIALGAPEE